jgi:putative NADH-flavin reductase
METQKIALFGASSKVGQGILNEALARGHLVTAIAADPKKITTNHPNLKVVQGDIINSNKRDIASQLRGQDVVICAYEPKANPKDHTNSTRAIIEGVKGEDIRHFIAFGHPGSQELEPELNMPSTEDGWKAVAQAQQNTLQALKKEKNIRWAYAHYHEIEAPIGKSKRPALGNEMTLVTNEGDRRFTAKDYAENTLDEIEHQMHEQSEL